LFRNPILVLLFAVILVFFGSVLFFRFNDEKLSEDARNTEVENYFITVCKKPEVLISGASFSSQVWVGMAENGDIYDSELNWAVYSKYEIHNYFLMLVFRLGIPLSIIWLVIVCRTYSGGLYLVAFLVLGITSNAFSTNPEALSSIFLSKLFHVRNQMKSNNKGLGCQIN
jgi:hypothetical protein